MFDSSIKKRLRKIIVQGYNDRTLGLFKDIIEVAREEFREDNYPTIAAFLVSHLFRAFELKDISTNETKRDLKKFIRNAMISELSQYCNTCSSLTHHQSTKSYSCALHGVALKNADYPDVYKCSKCANWE